MTWCAKLLGRKLRRLKRHPLNHSAEVLKFLHDAIYSFPKRERDSQHEDEATSSIMRSAVVKASTISPCSPLQTTTTLDILCNALRIPPTLDFYITHHPSTKLADGCSMQCTMPSMLIKTRQLSEG